MLYILQEKVVNQSFYIKYLNIFHSVKIFSHDNHNYTFRIKGNEYLKTVSFELLL